MMSRQLSVRPTVRWIALVAILAGLVTGSAYGKSLYVIDNINATPTPVSTYDIQPLPTYLQFQATTGVPRFGGGAVGLAIDTASAKLFVTYEISNTIQLVDATNFNDLGTTTAPGATNLAGIAVDQGKSKVYTVDRATNNLYVYSWNSTTNVLTLDGGAPVALTGVSEAYGLALDESRSRLYVGDNTTTVPYYDTNTLGSSPVAQAGSVDISAESQVANGIAIDSARNLLYTGDAYISLRKLVKYDLNTDTTSSYTLPSSGDNIVGLAVDEDTGRVYATTGSQGSGGTDTLIVFDSNLNVLKNDIGDIGNPTGIAIPRADVSFNPLNLTKDDFPDPVNSGSNLTYTICYDNAANVNPVNNVTIVDNLPTQASFVSATGGGVYNNPAHTVTWSVGTLAAGAPQVCYNLVVLVTAASDTSILNSVTIDSDDTPPTTRTQSTVVIEDPFGPELEAIEAKLDQLGPEVGAIEAKLDQLGPEVGAIEAKLDQLGPAVGVVEIKLDQLDPQIEALESKLDQLQPEITDIKAEIVDVIEMVEFKIDFEFEQALLECGCTPSLYLPEPGGNLERAIARVFEMAQLVATSMDPDLQDRVDRIECFLALAEEYADDGFYKKSCLALGSAIQLMDGHLDGDDEGSDDEEDLCLMGCFDDDDEGFDDAPPSTFDQGDWDTQSDFGRQQSSN